MLAINNRSPADGVMQASEEFDGCAKQLKALADPNRLRLVEALFAGPCSVSTLSELTGEPIVNVSHNLKVLRNAGLVETKRDGKFIIYSLRRDKKGRTAGKLDLGCCQLDLRP